MKTESTDQPETVRLALRPRTARGYRLVLGALLLLCAPIAGAVFTGVFTDDFKPADWTDYPIDAGLPLADQIAQWENGSEAPFPGPDNLYLTEYGLDLQWLDVTVTQNRSVKDVFGMTDASDADTAAFDFSQDIASGLFTGWRLATRDEVNLLYDNAPIVALRRFMWI